MERLTPQQKIARNMLKSTTQRHGEVEQDIRHELVDNRIVKSNFLARAKNPFKLVELRVVELMISKLNPNGMKLNIYQTIDITLTALEYAEATGTSKKIAYRDLEKTVDALQTKIIETREGTKRVKRPLMFKAEYEDGAGTVKASFHPEFLPHLINLRQQFTQYFLEDVLKFKSEYTWRIYEMCMSVKSQRDPVLILSVEEFRERLCIPESYKWSRVRDVIENSIAEIEEKTNYTVTVDMKKKGRAFNRLDFKVVKKKQQQKLELEI